MNPQLALWKTFVDGLVSKRIGVDGEWIRRKGWPDLPENLEINKLLSGLTPEQKEVLATIAQRARDGGIHDALVFLNERMNLKGLRIVEGGVEMAVEPYGTELFWDWVARSNGSPWPEHQLDKRYT
ncbi:MAG TPA: DUF6547 family protein [Humisphaera sp.]|nr:DUF6547 family protein [Humisphaera sp.]